MNAALRRVDGWLWPPAPPERLAMLRILTGAWTAGYLAVRLPAFLSLTRADRGAFAPVGVLAFVREPLPGAAVTILILGALVLAAVSATGLWFRVSGPLFAVVLLTLTTYRSSFGQILWFETLFTIHVVIVGFTPSADTLAVRSAGAPQRDPRIYGAAVRLAALVTVATYVLSGISKLRIGGWAWMSSDNLRNHVAYSAARLDLLGGTPSPIASWLMRHAWLLGPVAVATVVLELGAPLALVGRRARTAWVASIWLLHVGIAVGLLVVWGYPLWGVAFAPLFPLERLAERWRVRRSKRSTR